MSGNFCVGTCVESGLGGNPMILLLALTLCQDKDIRVEHEWKGTDSRIEALEFRRCLSAEEWGKLWERHAGKGTKAPDVDFDKSMIVAAFFGTRTGMKWSPSLETLKEGNNSLQAEVLGKIETNPIERVD